MSLSGQKQPVPVTLNGTALSGGQFSVIVHVPMYAALL